MMGEANDDAVYCMDAAGLLYPQSQVTVTDVAGSAADLKSPRFQAGQVIRMGSELCLVLDAESVVARMIFLRALSGGSSSATAWPARRRRR